MHFMFAFSQCSAGIYQAFDGLTEFLQFYPTRKNFRHAAITCFTVSRSIVSELAVDAFLPRDASAERGDATVSCPFVRL